MGSSPAECILDDINSLGLVLVNKLSDLRKARERELAILGEQLTSGGIAEPYAR